MDHITTISILDLIEDIKRAMKADAWFSALSLSFALIDKCGKIQYNKNDKYNFVHWVDDYICTCDYICWKLRPNSNGKLVPKKSHQKLGIGSKYIEKDVPEPYMDGELLYQLRCALLHGCSDNVDFEKLSNNDANSHLKSYNFQYQISAQYIEMGWSNIQSSVDCFNNYRMTVPIDGLIWPILLVVNEFYDSNKEKFNSITIIDYKNVYK